MSIKISDAVREGILRVDSEWKNMSYRDKSAAVSRIVEQHRDDIKDPTWIASCDTLSKMFTTVVPDRINSHGTAPFWGTQHFIYMSAILRADAVRDLCLQLIDEQEIAPSTVCGILRLAKEVQRMRGLDLRATFLGLVSRLKAMDSSGKTGLHGAWSEANQVALRKEYGLSPSKSKKKREVSEKVFVPVDVTTTPATPPPAPEPTPPPEEPKRIRKETPEVEALGDQMRDALDKLLEIRLQGVPDEHRSPIRDVAYRTLRECLDYVRLTSRKFAGMQEELRLIDERKARADYEDACLRLLGQAPKKGQLEDLRRVKTVYRDGALACHPDRHQNDPRAAEKFDVLTKSYTTIIHYHETHAQMA